MNNNNQSKQEAQNTNWRDTIRQAAETAEKYATDVANDYTRDWTEAKQEDREDAARSAAGAFDHASAWYRTARQLREAVDESQNNDEADAARRVREAIEEAGRNADQADWCCPITEELQEAGKQALAEAEDRYTAKAAADIAAAFANAAIWG